MNAVKRIARKRHIRKQYGPGHEVLADNRNFRERGESSAVGLIRRDELLGRLDSQKRKRRVAMIEFIEANRDSIDLTIASGTFVGFHGDLQSKTFGEIESLAMLMGVAVKAQRPAAT